MRDTDCAGSRCRRVIVIYGVEVITQNVWKKTLNTAKLNMTLPIYFPIVPYMIREAYLTWVSSDTIYSLDWYFPRREEDHSFLTSSRSEKWTWYVHYKVHMLQKLHTQYSQVNNKICTAWFSYETAKSLGEL